MRIGNRKRFLFSCIFFTLVMLMFGKWMNIFYEKALGMPSPAVVKAEKGNIKVGSNKKNMKQYIIVLDAGHGGIDAGTSYKNMQEKDLTFKIAKYAEAYLKDKGYKVVLTRNEDKLIPLKEIGNIANASNADAFISIHINSINDVNFNGITTYYYDANGYQKEQRMSLAETVEKKAIKNDGWEDKGIRRQNLAVLRYSKMPSVLVECGFITNEEDRKRLLKDDVLKRLAENISDGTIEYLDKNNPKELNK
ncbi:N-acetylmuramoyl-L-alanine amidase [Clostridiaceae bacterium UIB06]|uniref:N-acetylmuramoyl-L-alanine amidase n=1 Tax=Clostridium thailandense TaxID=2794346 RepID=A0A949WQ14_9CLOT|nr:N-acetylmuramoyl-L-alanine amidase [Clostridium thailandense]MBV7272136.1 N-acetylmuramoyl-L-alanine amidase [Clostridium thailandense]MCH5136012.1 N-acetylmuramoyl-L-alanine amidase [Clostridiaceae bacterium UIB06]